MLDSSGNQCGVVGVVDMQQRMMSIISTGCPQAQGYRLPETVLRNTTSTLNESADGRCEVNQESGEIAVLVCI